MFRGALWTSAAAVAGLNVGAAIVKYPLKPAEYLEQSALEPELATPELVYAGLPSPEPFEEFKPDRTHLSPYFDAGRDGEEIDTIVVHTSEGKGSGTEAWFMNNPKGVSAHYVIMEDGEVLCMVEDQNTARHVRAHNKHTLGIEYAGFGKQPLTQEQIDSGTALIASKLDQYGLSLDAVKPHYDLDSKLDPGIENYQQIMNALDLAFE